MCQCCSSDPSLQQASFCDRLCLRDGDQHHTESGLPSWSSGSGGGGAEEVGGADGGGGAEGVGVTKQNKGVLRVSGGDKDRGQEAGERDTGLWAEAKQQPGRCGNAAARAPGRDSGQVPGPTARGRLEWETRRPKWGGGGRDAVGGEGGVCPRPRLSFGALQATPWAAVDTKWDTKPQRVPRRELVGQEESHVEVQAPRRAGTS